MEEQRKCQISVGLDEALREKLAVTLWPTAGQALDMRRGATYRAAAEGSIPTLDVGRLKRVSTSWLRQKLGLDEPGTVA